MIRTFEEMTPVIGEGVYVDESAVVNGNVTLAEQVSVWFNASVRGDTDQIIVGKCSNIQDNCVLHNSGGIPLIIGSYVTVGHGAILHSCTIGDNSLIGMGAIVLDGAKVGKNCLIGAGALVTPNQEIPDNSLVLGSPGKVVKLLSAEQVAKHRVNAETYLQLTKRYLKRD